ncbi:Molybdenum cofactor synthesis protein 3 [Clydaea vesicula]|uniref:Molybdenum cofactor synthesis protein 3 n=1 Tax=Clydaea vesicula TaxID=447962 RepID=A0AAD5XUC8_9FUNG|nr:Molybdenum cofactor synthesis protein 3 [Clydaea vesicula]
MFESKKLTKDEIERFSRQLLIKEIGVEGQIKLRNSKVLVVGAGKNVLNINQTFFLMEKLGGLGSPVILYLAATGIGKLGIVDYDEVESSNLQRQVIHNQYTVGKSKSDSAKLAVESLTSFTNCISYNILLDTSNAMDLIKNYDVVVDCTDNVATRYLLNDSCVLNGKPLVSGSVSNCGDAGVLGAVTGVIGCLQALETVKLICGIGPSYFKKLLLFDALTGMLRVVKLRSKQPTCEICSEEPKLKCLIDYIQFCGGKGANDKAVDINVLDEKYKVDVSFYNGVRKGGLRHLLFDVREEVEFNICSLEDSLNIPLLKFKSNFNFFKKKFEEDSELTIYCICRRGNDSQIAVNFLKNEIGFKNVFDIQGGFLNWSKIIDNDFPIY